MISYTFKPTLKLAIWKLSGQVSADEVIHSLQKMVAQPEYVAGMSVIADHREVESEFTLEDFMSITIETKFIYGKFGKKVRCATIFAKEIQFSMGQMYAAYSKDTPLEFYPTHSMEEAIEWLGLTGKLDLK